MNTNLRTVALVTLVAVGAFAGAAAGASNGSLKASPTSPGQTSTHTATLTAGDDAAGSLNGFQVDYSDTGVDVSNVGTEDVVAVGIDVDDDADGKTIDKNVSDDLSSIDSSNNGETVTFGFGGSYDVDAGDEIVVVFENAQNADAGQYEVGLEINPQSSGGEGTATLTLGDNDRSSTETATEGPAGDDTETAGETADGTDDGDTGASAPGFGAALTVLALVGAAFVATRRRS